MALQHEIEGISSHNSSLCFQCSKCTASCPMAEWMDFNPAHVMPAIRFGQAGAVLTAVEILIKQHGLLPKQPSKPAQCHPEDRTFST